VWQNNRSARLSAHLAPLILHLSPDYYALLGIRLTTECSMCTSLPLFCSMRLPGYHTCVPAMFQHLTSNCRKVQTRTCRVTLAGSHCKVGSYREPGTAGPVFQYLHTVCIPKRSFIISNHESLSGPAQKLFSNHGAQAYGTWIR
jgi:hypothetical protein